MALQYIQVISDTGEVIKPTFTFNGHVYRFTATHNLPPYDHYVMDVIDTLTRDDGVTIHWRRRVIKDYFEGKIKDKRKLKDYGKDIRSVPNSITRSQRRKTHSRKS